MLKLVLSALVLAVSGQNSCQDIYRQCLASAPVASACDMLICPTATPKCCDSTLPACQDMYKMCLASGMAGACDMIMCPVRPQPSSDMRPSSTTAPQPSSDTDAPSPRPSSDMKQSDAPSPRPSYDMKQSDAPSPKPSSDPMPSSTTRQLPSSDTDAPSPRPSYDMKPTSKPSSDPQPSPKPSSDPQPSPRPSSDMRPSSTTLPSSKPTRKPMFSAFPSPKGPRPTLNLTAGSRIISSVSFRGMNKTAFENVLKLRELQVHIACAMHVVADCVTFESITFLPTNELIRWNKSVYDLSEIPAIDCIQTARRRVRVRRLQSSSSVKVVYVINEPPPELFQMTSSEFTDLLSTSSSINTFAASVGSTGVSTAASPVPASPASPASAGPSIVGIVVGCICGTLIVSVGVMFVLRHYEKKNRKLPIRSVHIQKTSNPAFVEDRTIFEPMRSRV